MDNELDRKGKRGRPTLQLMEERDSEIVQMLLDCKPKSYIYTELNNKYNIGRKAVDALLSKAYISIKENYAVDRENVINTHIQKYYKIVDDATTLYDTKSQLGALAAIEKLLRLHQPDVAIQQNHLTLDLKDYSVDDLKKLLSGENME